MPYKFLLLAVSVFISLQAPLSRADWIPQSSSGRPSDAVVGGFANNKPMYLCRAHHQSDLQPGWTQDGTSCHFGYSGTEQTATTFDWWVPTWQLDNIPGLPVPNAIPFGWESNNAPPPQIPGHINRFPCQGFEPTIYTKPIPGKFASDLGGCLFPFNGLENHQTSKFYVLVDPSGNPSSPSSMPGADAYFGPFKPQLINGALIPPDAIVGGADVNGQPLYLCAAAYGSGYQPGKISTALAGCHFGYNGAEQSVSPSYVLVPDWTPESGGDFSRKQSDLSVFTNPIPMGKDTDGSILYACQAASKAGGDLIPGKLSHAFSGCHIGAAGMEDPRQQYSLLTDGFLTSAPR